jgi:hypothetical protein
VFPKNGDHHAGIYVLRRELNPFTDCGEKTCAKSPRNARGAPRPNRNASSAPWNSTIVGLGSLTASTAGPRFLGVSLGCPLRFDLSLDACDGRCWCLDAPGEDFSAFFSCTTQYSLASFTLPSHHVAT